MIPAIIHYVWLGESALPKTYLDCMSTWSTFAHNFQVIRWDEKTYFNEFGDNKFVEDMLRNKKYAFASDYIRCQVLAKFGGIYLDTDMELVKDITPLLNNIAFLGEEDKNVPSCGILGCESGFWLFNDLKDLVKESNGLYTIPVLLKETLKSRNIERSGKAPIETIADITIYEDYFFYPYNPYGSSGKSQLLYKYVTPDCYAIHHWAKTWKLSFTERLLKKMRSKISKC